MALTFDEGYENGYTASILDTLKEKGVQAVFFITGDYLDAEPELVGRMIEEGHIVGNHSENHPSFPTISLDKQREELAALAKKMEDQFQYTMTLFRPPCGEFSERMLENVRNFGYKTVFWSYAYKDWDPEGGIGAEAKRTSGAYRISSSTSSASRTTLGQRVVSRPSSWILAICAGSDRS